MSKLNVLLTLILICSLSLTLTLKLKKSKSKYEYLKDPQPYPGEKASRYTKYNAEPMAQKLRNILKEYVSL